MQGNANRIGQEFKRRVTETFTINHMLCCTILISNAMAEGLHLFPDQFL